MFRDPGRSLCILSPGRLNQETLASAQALLAAGGWREIWPQPSLCEWRGQVWKKSCGFCGLPFRSVEVCGSWNKPFGPVLSLLLVSWLEPATPSCGSSLTLC